MTNLTVEVVIRVDPETLQRFDAMLSAVLAHRQGAPQNGRADDAAGRMPVKNTAWLERGFVDKSLLDDSHWLRARYVDDRLTLAEIGGMCGVHAQTVSKRLKAAGIQVQRGRHRSPAPDADPPDEDPPEGQAD